MNQRRTIILWCAFLATLLAVGFLCQPCHAASPFDQLSLSVGAQGRWLDTPHLNAEPDFEAVGNAAVTLTPHIDVTGGLALGFGGSYMREQVDGRYSVADQGNGFSVWIGGGYYWSEDFDDGLDGWAAKAGVGWQPSLTVPATVGLTVAQTPEDGRSSVSISGTWLIKRGGQ